VLHTGSPRGARPLVAPLVAALLALAGCTSSSSSTPAASPTTTSTAPASPPPVDPAARAALRHAAAVTAKVRSYSFTARTVVQANQTVHSTITGRVVRGNGLTYRLTTGKQRTQVVRLPSGTYVRQVPGKWSRLTHPRRVVNPTHSLLAVVRGLTPTDVAESGHGQVVRGSLTAAAAAKAGLPHDRGLVHAAVRIDRHGRVVGLVVRTHTAAGATAVGVVVRSSYLRFGRARPVHPPV
jgi:hypothetical protein